MSIFIVSDLHFNHANIIKYSNRPFNDTYYMNQKLIENWNSVVADTDEVYFLGDFRFGRHSEEEDCRLVNSLKGIKRMIVGNHDFRFVVYNKDLTEKLYRVDTLEDAKIYWTRMGFVEAFSQPILLDNFYILSHHPVDGINHSQVFLNIHGHTHDVKMTNGNYFNACVECIDYTPINFEKIKEITANDQDI